MVEPSTRELDQMWESIDKMDKKIDRVLEQLTLNRIKVSTIAAVLGFIGGCVPLAVAILLKVVK
jgi:hypothetical protein